MGNKHGKIAPGSPDAALFELAAELARGGAKVAGPATSAAPPDDSEECSKHSRFRSLLTFRVARSRAATSTFHGPDAPGGKSVPAARGGEEDEHALDPPAPAVPESKEGRRRQAAAGAPLQRATSLDAGPASKCNAPRQVAAGEEGAAGAFHDRRRHRGAAAAARPGVSQDGPQAGGGRQVAGRPLELLRGERILERARSGPLAPRGIPREESAKAPASRKPKNPHRKSWSSADNLPDGSRATHGKAAEPEFVPLLPYPTGALADRYILTGEVLGKGNFGQVAVCVDKRGGGRRAACKTILKASLRHADDAEVVRREVLVMRHLAGHGGVVALLAVFEDAAAVHLVMELCLEGPLSTQILERHHFPEHEAAAIFRQVVKSVRHVHAAGVMHRDLKPENILLSRPPPGAAGGGAGGGQEEYPQVKLADFGLAVYLRPWQQTAGLAGSPYYFAPEVVAGTPYGREADIWSLGVILYVLLSGMLPFYGDGEREIFERIRVGKVHFGSRHWKGVSRDARALVLRLLMIDPQWRPTADEILKFPFLTRHLSSDDGQAASPPAGAC